MKKYKIYIYDPYKVYEQNDLLSDETQALEITSGDDGIPNFKNRSQIKKWIEDYIDIVEMI